MYFRRRGILVVPSIPDNKESLNSVPFIHIIRKIRGTLSLVT